MTVSSRIHITQIYCSAGVKHQMMGERHFHCCASLFRCVLFFSLACWADLCGGDTLCGWKVEQPDLVAGNASLQHFEMSFHHPVVYYRCCRQSTHSSHTAHLINPIFFFFASKQLFWNFNACMQSTGLASDQLICFQCLVFIANIGQWATVKVRDSIPREHACMYVCMVECNINC